MKFRLFTLAAVIANNHRGLECVPSRHVDRADRRRGWKILKLGGRLPVNLQLAAYDNICTPRNGADWQLRFQLQVMLPKAIFESK